MIKLNNQIMSFSIEKFIESKQNDITLMYLNLLKIFYFFSVSKDIFKFIMNAEIEIRITKSNDFNDVIAHGTTQGIKHFDPINKKNQKLQTVVYMFFMNEEFS